MKSFPKRERPSVGTIKELYDLLIEVEKRLACGPWDSWDHEVLEQWRAIVRAQISEATARLSRELETSRLVAERPLGFRPFAEIVEPV